ncbi:type VI secretion system ATPase TssH [Dongshaea marina]|uniref:type VI secretion system ATPase TssH n=1 Tax=Dongshaea marina TaxID=2047966 RepID=UPI000D3E786E|nr:type VI secretion system ATPase TssH [Dongshaea marina]
MVNISLKTLLGKLNYYCSNTLNNAAGLCVSRTQYEVTPEHWLLKCLEAREGDWQAILTAQGVDVNALIIKLNRSLEELATGNSGKPVFSPRLTDLLTDAWLVASVDLELAQIRSGAVLLALLAKPMSYGQSGWFECLRKIDREQLQQQFFALVRESAEQAEPAATEGKTEGGESKAGGFVERFCIDFTAKAAGGTLDPVFGRDPEIRQMVDILARRRKNNPILVGEPGVGKTAVMEGLALRIHEGDVPESLEQVRLLGLDMGALEAGAGMKGEFENRLKGVIDEIKSSERPIILFIDEAHTLIGAGGSVGGSDAANLLKPALARGELKTCAATTWGEYKKYFEKDPALARRFQLVKLDEPSVATSALILRGLRDSYERSHQVVIRDDALQAAAELSDRYISGRFLPDKAIDLMDTACARVKVNLRATPPALEDVQRRIQALSRQQQGLERDAEHGQAIDPEALAELKEGISEGEVQAEALTASWQAEQQAVQVVLAVREKLAQAQESERTTLLDELNAAREALAEVQQEPPMLAYEVTPELMAQVVCDWTGIPLGKMAQDQASLLLNLEQEMGARIKGQDAALGALSTVLRAAKSGLTKPEQPLGVFLLVGPSGVGKTETGLTLAELLFGSESHLVTINMSEFQEKHTVSRLIGSPPGYVGYGEGGMLTEAVRQQPYSVVLLDEVEKAHPDVLNLFYQVFDKGVLNDGEGQTINFANTVILLTSNLASDVITELCGEGCDAETIGTAIRPMLNEHFKPALLARMTLLPYGALPNEAMAEITELKLGQLKQMLKHNNGVTLSYSDAVVEQIVARCDESETGARNIDFILNGRVLPELSRAVLAQMGDESLPAVITLSCDDAGNFEFDFSESVGEGA